MSRVKKVSVRSRRLLKSVLLLIVALMAIEYARLMTDLAGASDIVAGLLEKPYVYRALVPWLAHLLVLLGLQPEVALTILLVLSAIGLLYGIQYLLAAFRRS